MRYWYKLSDASKWEDMIIAGEDIPVNIVPVYEETKEIVDNFENDPLSDWWPVKGFGDGRLEFEDEDDAEAELYADLGDSLYCRLHDC